MPISPELLRILRCPRCRGPVAPAAGASALDCARCGLSYPVVDGVAVMIAEEAVPAAAARGERDGAA